MSRPSLAVALWGAFLAGLALLLLGWERSWLQVLLLGGAALVVLALAAALVRSWGSPREPRDADVSLPVPVLACGIALALLGLPFGTWLLLPGLGLTVLGAAGVLAEVRK